MQNRRLDLDGTFAGWLAGACLSLLVFFWFVRDGLYRF
jgi:hypothetical protein